ncbi:hypothetical protein [Variovorax boronicumulans]|uniref:hypothetical protein n=1 Tax=Variovorax boronicumulans TaxID=436515 RepID=UPI00339A7890
MAEQVQPVGPLLPMARSATEEITLLSQMLRTHIADNSTDVEISLLSRGILTRIEALANVAWSAVMRSDEDPEDEATLLRELGGRII